MKNIPFIFLFILMVSCQTNSTDQQQINQLQSELAKAKAELAAPVPPLVHVVYLNLREDITELEIKDLANAIEKLKEIPVVKNLEYGKFIKLEDPRAMSDYEMILQMNFANAADYATYQAHPIHLALKEVAKVALTAPPATYDYILSR